MGGGVARPRGSDDWCGCGGRAVEETMQKRRIVQRHKEEFLVTHEEFLRSCQISTAV
jgi:hypothetical protein